MIKPVFSFGLPLDAKAIREAVFVAEQGFQNEFDDLDASCWHLVLYLDEFPISTGRLLKIDPETYQLSRIAVLPQFRGKKVGSYTMKFLMNKAISLGARKCKVCAQLDKRAFYEKVGFRVDGDGEIVYDEGCPHIWMSRKLFRSRSGRN